MVTLKAMMAYRPSPPETVVGENSVEEPAHLRDDVWEAVQETQQGCTCKGAPHDDDCAVVRNFGTKFRTMDVAPNVPRWAKEPETKSYDAGKFTAPYKDGKMIHDKESS
jgi:hypothetical protein